MKVIVDNPTMFGVKLRDRPAHFLRLSKVEIAVLREAENILDRMRTLAGVDTDIWIDAGIPSAGISDLIDIHGDGGIRLD
jgi:hypothetical protein